MDCCHKGMEDFKHYCHKGTEEFKYYCHKGVETIVKRSYYLFPIFPHGEKTYREIDNRGSGNRIIDRGIDRVISFKKKGDV